MRKVVTTLGLATLSCVSILVNAANEPKMQKSVVMSAPVKTSQALRDIAKPLPTITEQRKFKLTQSGEMVPGFDKAKEVPNRFPEKDRDYKLPEGFVDKSAQTSLKKSAYNRLAPEIGVSFDGVGNVQGYAPPDTNGDVGPNHYVQTVNVAMGVFDKTGNVLLAPTAINNLWAGFGGICETNNDGDPIVLYDGAADRWLISQFALNGTDNHECIAISTTGDPTGTYYLYDFAYGALMNDYPHFGVWSNGYFMGVNQFDPANNFAWSGGGVVAYERDKMLTGAPAQQVKFDMQGSNPEVFTPMPLDMDGLTPPPAGSPEYFIWSSLDSTDELHVWEFDVDWNDVASATFSPVTTISVTPYGSAPAITQPNGQALDSLSIRSMFRAAYRNLDGQGKVVFTHNIAAPAGQGVTAVRWYEIDVNQIAGTATLTQESTFAPDTTSRWMGSGAMDVNGNIAFGYSMASTSMEPSIGAATRLATDPLNTLTDEVVLHVGEGSQSGTSRWGDYSSLSVDPVDDCTFWFTTEYYKTANSGSTAWSTRISSFKVPSCSAGPRGEISGTVTDSATDQPIANATVTVGLFSAKTDADGNYLATMPIGDYDITASRYGWIASTASSITIEEDTVTDADISLGAASAVVVSGNVTDGGGLGANLYAKISVTVPDDRIVSYTDPESGDYSISLFEGTTVSFEASEVGSGGYLATTRDILPTAAMADEDFVLSPNSNCSALGYQWVDPAFYEGFDVFPATGWTVVDEIDGGLLWTSYLSSGRALGFDTDAAISDSDAMGSAVTGDTSLISPTINVADIDTTVLEFDSYFRTYTGADSVDVDINVDGAGWTNIGTLAATGNLLANTIDIAAEVVAATSFQLRWRHYNANWEWYAGVDNVRFGNRVCEVIAGTLVKGYVTDANNGEALVGASISIDGSVATTSAATPADVLANDGFFQAFVPSTSSGISVAKNQYETAEVDTNAISTLTPVALNAGLLESSSTAIAATMTAGRSGSEDVSVANIGTADAEFAAYFVKGNPNSLMFGPFHPSTRHFGPKDLGELNTKKTRNVTMQNIEPLAPGDLVGFFPTDITYGWGISVDRNSGEFYIGDLAAGGAPIDAIWKYDASGALTGEGIAINFAADFFADSAFNQRTGKLWQVNVGGDNCIYELDTVALTATGDTICPSFAISQRGLAYDPITDTFYSGSWTDSIIHQFDTNGTIIRSVNVGLGIAGLAFNAETNHLFISVNGQIADGDFDIVVVDAASPDLVKIGGYDVRLDVDGDGIGDDVISDYGQAGLDIDCDGNLWIVDQNQQFAVGFESGETGVCEWNNVPWLSLSANSGSIAADESSDVSVNFDSAGMSAGDYAASIVYSNDTPYGSLSIPVSMTLNAPSYGVTQFVVSNVDVDENNNATLSVERVGGNDYAVTVDFATMDGSAIAGVDYTATAGTLSWNDLDAAIKTISVPTSLLDEHKTLSVVLSNAQGGSAVGAKSAMTVTIKDKPKGGGSFGAPLLMLFALVAVFRRKKATAK